MSLSKIWKEIRSWGKIEDFPKFYGPAYLFKAIAYDSDISKVNNDIISSQKDNGWEIIVTVLLWWMLI